MRKKRVVAILSMLLLAIAIAFSITTTAEAKVKKSTTITITKANKSSAKKLHKALIKYKEVNIRIKSKSIKKADKIYMDLNAQLALYNKKGVILRNWIRNNRIGKIGERDKENKKYITYKEDGCDYRSLLKQKAILFLEINKADDATVNKIQNIFLNSKDGLCEVFWVKGNEEQAKALLTELNEKIAKLNVYGWRPFSVDDYKFIEIGDYCRIERGGYLYAADMCPDNMEDTDYEDYKYGIKLLDEIVTEYKTELMTSLNNGSVSSEQEAQVQVRINTNFCEYSTALQYKVLARLWSTSSKWTHYNYEKYNKHGGMQQVRVCTGLKNLLKMEEQEMVTMIC